MSNKISKQTKSANLEKKLSNYNRKQILAALKEINCDPNKDQSLLHRFRIASSDDVKGKYISIKINVALDNRIRFD